MLEPCRFMLLRRSKDIAKPIEIGHDVSIGEYATIICPGIKVISCVVVVAGSVVTQDIPDYFIVASIRATIKKEASSIVEALVIGH